MMMVLRAEFLESQEKFEAIDPVLTGNICRGRTAADADRVAELERQLEELKVAKLESDENCQKYARQIHDLNKANRTLEAEKVELTTACDTERGLTASEKARADALQVELDALKKAKEEVENVAITFTVAEVKKHLTSARHKIRNKYPDHQFDFSDLDFKKIELPEGFTASDCSYNEEVDDGEDEGEEVNNIDAANEYAAPSSSAPKE